MAKYFTIANRGTFDRQYLEYLGHTSKDEDDSSTIGKNGSGTRRAAIASLRLGFDLVISSSDAEGSYVAVFESIPLASAAGKSELFIRYYDTSGAEGAPKHGFVGTKLLTEAYKDAHKPVGTDPMQQYKALCEIMCNARDKDSGFVIQDADKVLPAPEGWTYVYVTVTAQIMSMIFDHPARYFKFASGTEPMHLNPLRGAMYMRSDPDNTRLFGQGAMIECLDGAAYPSAFDYSLIDKHLLEERVLKSLPAFERRLGQLLRELDDEGIATTILSAVMTEKGKLEEAALATMNFERYPERKKFWQRIAALVIGEKIALACYNPQIDNDAEQIFGFKVIRGASYDIQVFLLKLGVHRTQDILPRLTDEDIDLLPLKNFDAASRARLMEARRIFTNDFPSRRKIPVEFFIAKTEMAKRYGEFVRTDGPDAYSRIYVKAISRTELGSVKDLLIMMVHGSRHCVTRTGDYIRKFQDHADIEVVSLMLRRHGYIASEDLSYVRKIPPIPPIPPPFLKKQK